MKVVFGIKEYEKKYTIVKMVKNILSKSRVEHKVSVGN